MLLLMPSSLHYASLTDESSLRWRNQADNANDVFCAFQSDLWAQYLFRLWYSAACPLPVYSALFGLPV